MPCGIVSQTGGSSRYAGGQKPAAPAGNRVQSLHTTEMRCHEGILSFPRKDAFIFVFGRIERTMKNPVLRNLVFAALCLALCLYLPFLTGQIPEIGKALSPMHIPVLLCGFLCGWPHAVAVGLVAPFLRFMLFSMPELFPTGVAMAFELAVYGLATSLLYRGLPKKPGFLYVSLIGAMLAGRVVWGCARWLIAGFAGTEFTFEMFLAGAFTTAVPGIICHILLIPPIVLALQKAKVLRIDAAA